MRAQWEVRQSVTALLTRRAAKSRGACAVVDRSEAKTDPRTEANTVANWAAAGMGTAFRVTASRQNEPPDRCPRQQQLSQLQQDIRFLMAMVSTPRR